MESYCSVWGALVQSIAARIRASAYVMLAHWRMELDRYLPRYVLTCAMKSTTAFRQTFQTLPAVSKVTDELEAAQAQQLKLALAKRLSTSFTG